MASQIEADSQMNFQPPFKLIPEEDRDTLALDVTGFRKDQLKAQLDRQSRIIKISGARQLEDNRKIGFYKEFPISPNCDTQKITARFDGGMLFISMPKLIVPEEKEGSKLPPVVTGEPQTSKDKPEQAGQKTSASDDQNKQKGISEKSRRDENAERTSANDDHKKQIDAKKSPDKGEKEVSNAKNQEQARDDQKRQNGAYEKSHVEENGKKTSANDDQKKQIDAKKSPEKGETEVSNAKNEQAHEKTSASNDQNVNKIAKNLHEKSGEKEEVEPTAHKRDVKEKSAGRKHNGVDENRSAKTCLSDKQGEISSTGIGQNASLCAATGACDPAAMLKMARQKMNMVMVFVLVLLLALYVGNKFVWYSKKGEE